MAVVVCVVLGESAWAERSGKRWSVGQIKGLGRGGCRATLMDRRR